MLILSISPQLVAKQLHATTWSLRDGTFESVVLLFNEARKKEGIGPLLFPDEKSWDITTNSCKMLYIINIERQERGLLPMSDCSSIVQDIAQRYADLLIREGRFSHRIGGNNAWGRLHNEPRIASCHKRIPYAENLARFISDKGYQKYPIERALFEWFYNDELHNWKHREMLLYEGYENVLIGTGISKGSFKDTQYMVYVVLNLFEPCDSWDTQKEGE
ncbi:MAG: CAP domain-containing protein [Campylobacterales bacterium]|nr:CAP domain-containing protein [Campylobacterales bacterium]